MSAEFRILHREVWWPPLPEVREGSLSWCPRVEVGLAKSGERWVVLWRTPHMSAVAWTTYPCLREAWASYRRHREAFRALTRAETRTDRLAELDRRITALQRERDQLARLMQEGAE